VLRSVGSHQQCFRASIKVTVLGVGQNCTKQSADASATWFAGDDSVEVFTETFCVRALPAPLEAF
jgi:hypothetical protein